MRELTRVPEHLKQLLGMVENVRDRVQNEIDCVTEGNTLPDGLFKQLVALSKTSTDLSKELRAWKVKLDKHMDEMGLEERVLLTIEFIQSLSLGDRRNLYNYLSQAEVDRPDARVPLHVTK